MASSIYSPIFLPQQTPDLQTQSPAQWGIFDPWAIPGASPAVNEARRRYYQGVPPRPQDVKPAHSLIYPAPMEQQKILPEPQWIEGDFSRSALASTIGTNPKMMGGAADALGTAFGIDWLQKSGRSLEQFGEGYLQQLRPDWTTYRQVGSFPDLVDYVQTMSGQAVGTMIPSMAGGAIGAAVSGGPWGAALGAIGPSYFQNLGDVWTELRDDPSIKTDRRGLAWAAMAAAVPMAVLDSAAVNNILAGPQREALKKAVKQGAIKRLMALGSHVLSSGKVEGITEALQAATAEATASVLGADRNLRQQADRVINEGIAGALGGALMGGVTTKEGAAAAAAGAAATAAPQVVATMAGSAGILPAMFVGPSQELTTQAETAEKAGAKRGQIWDKFLMVRGAEGRWRTEIEDKTADVHWPMQSVAKDPAAMKANGYFELESILDHSKLYEAYPDLAHLKVFALPQEMMDQGVRAAYQPDSDTIGINLQMLKDSGKNSAVKARIKTDLLHEVQHAVQTREGWGTGASISHFEELANEADGIMGMSKDPFVAALVKKIETEGLDPVGKFDDFSKLMDGLATTQTNMMKIMAVLHTFQKQKTPITQKNFAKMRTQAYNTLQQLYSWGRDESTPEGAIDLAVLYRKISGEAEARNTGQQRAGLDLEERRAAGPWDTLDVPWEQQIVADFSTGGKGIVGEAQTFESRRLPMSSFFTESGFVYEDPPRQLVRNLYRKSQKHLSENYGAEAEGDPPLRYVTIGRDATSGKASRIFVSPSYEGTHEDMVESVRRYSGIDPKLEIGYGYIQNIEDIDDLFDQGETWIGRHGETRTGEGNIFESRKISGENIFGEPHDIYVDPAPGRIKRMVYEADHDETGEYPSDRVLRWIYVDGKEYVADASTMTHVDIADAIGVPAKDIYKDPSNYGAYVLDYDTGEARRVVAKDMDESYLEDRYYESRSEIARPRKIRNPFADIFVNPSEEVLAKELKGAGYGFTHRGERYTPRHLRYVLTNRGNILVSDGGVFAHTQILGNTPGFEDVLDRYLAFNDEERQERDRVDIENVIEDGYLTKVRDIKRLIRVAEELKLKAKADDTSDLPTYSDQGYYESRSPDAETQPRVLDFYPAPTWYSALDEATKQLPPKGRVDQMLAQLRKIPGVKGEEIEWRGLDQLDPQRVMTRQELQAYLRENPYQLEETVRKKRAPGEEEDFNPTKYSEYALLGGENYREVLLRAPHMPRIDPRTLTAERSKDPVDELTATYLWRVSEPGGQSIAVRAFTEAQAKRDAADQWSGAEKNYKSAHWDEENVLAHIRMNDRVIDGKKTLFVEEIQSDWHQTGRSKGYFKKVPEDYLRGLRIRKRGGPDIEVEHSQGRWLVRHKDESGDWSTFEFSTEERALRRAQEIEQRYLNNYVIEDAEGNRVDEISRGIAGSEENALDLVRDRLQRFGQQMTAHAVPDAPFKKTWPALAMKRVISEAARKGYDQVAWTGSEIQSGRWQGHGDFQTFYDKILVDEANKIGKKHGARAEPSKLKGRLDLGERLSMQRQWIREHGEQVPRDAAEIGMLAQELGFRIDKVLPEYDVWTLPITDSLRQSVERVGLPMFNQSKESQLWRGSHEYRDFSGKWGDLSSQKTYERGGKLYTVDPQTAAEALYAGQDVVLEQPVEVSVMLDRLHSELVDPKTKDINLGKVEVPGTNLFTDNKGLPRIEMPQLKGEPTPGSVADAMEKDPRGEVDVSDLFKDYLDAKGYKIEQSEELAANLRPTQGELNAGKSAFLANLWREGKLDGGVIFVSRDNYILDGHHRWAGIIAADYDDNRASIKVPIYRVDADIIDMIHEARQFANDVGIPQVGMTDFIGKAFESRETFKRGIKPDWSALTPAQKKIVDQWSVFGGEKAILQLGEGQKLADYKAAEGDALTKWLRFGFYVGAEGKVRFEIPDHSAKWKVPEGFGTVKTVDDMLDGHIGEALRLDEVLDHDQLFEAYPELKRLGVIFAPDEGENYRRESAGAQAEWMPGMKTIWIYETRWKKPDLIMEEMIHELQHAIQDIEGFAPGADSSVGEYDNFAGMEEYARDMYAEEEGYDSFEAIDDPVIKSRIQKEAYDYAMNQAYEQTSGEVEARNAANRYSRGWLTTRPPFETEDYPRYDQILRDRRGRPQGAGKAYQSRKFPTVEQDVRNYLKIIDSMAFPNARKDNPSMPTAASYLLEHGREFEAYEDTYSGPRGEAHQCYMNAAHAAFEGKGTYVEGYIVVFGVPLAHAWIVDDQGRVIDPTIEDSDGIMGYFGVPLTLEALTAQLVSNEVYGVLTGQENYEQLRTLIDQDPAEVIPQRYRQRPEPSS